MDSLVETARRHQPRMLMVDRTVGGEHENYLTTQEQVPDQPIPDKP